MKLEMLYNFTCFKVSVTKSEAESVKLKKIMIIITNIILWKDGGSFGLLNCGAAHILDSIFELSLSKVSRVSFYN